MKRWLFIVLLGLSSVASAQDTAPASPPAAEPAPIDRWNSLSEEERAHVREAFERFRSLSPEEKARQDAADKQARDQRYCTDDKIAALVMAQKLVKGTLKAPATAEFASIVDSQVTTIGDCSYRVVSYVDSQNSFGANIRTTSAT